MTIYLSSDRGVLTPVFGWESARCGFVKSEAFIDNEAELWVAW